MGAGSGIGQDNIAEESFARYVKETFTVVSAADVDYVVNETAADALSNGDTLTLMATADGVPLPSGGHFVTMTLVDADQNLQMTCKVEGRRAGKYVSASLTADTATSSPVTVTSTVIFDEVETVTVTSVSEAATSVDTVAIGIAGSALGFRLGRIKAVTDVKDIIFNNAGTPERTEPSSTSVNAAESAIIGLTLAAGDTYEVLYKVNGDLDGIEEKGAWA